MITDLMKQVNDLIHDFVLNGYTNLVQAYAQAVISMITLSVVSLGYAAYNGYIELTLDEIGRRTILIAIILMLALNWGNFSEDVYSLFVTFPDELATHLVSSVPGGAFSDATDAASSLQVAWDNMMQYIWAIFQQGSWSSPMPYVWSGLLLILGVILVVFALGELIIAKFGLAIFLVLAPLAIPTLMFKSTKQIIFDGWLRHLVGFAFIPVFICTALALSLSLISKADVDLQRHIALHQLTIKYVAPYFIGVAVSCFLLTKAAQISASLAGSFTAGVSQQLSDVPGRVKSMFGGKPSGSGNQFNVKGDGNQLNFYNDDPKN